MIYRGVDRGYLYTIWGYITKVFMLTYEYLLIYSLFVYTSLWNIPIWVNFCNPAGITIDDLTAQITIGTLW